MKNLVIIFIDGSNPYIRYGLNERQYKNEMNKWLIEYSMVLIKVVGGNIFVFEAKERMS